MTDEELRRLAEEEAQYVSYTGPKLVADGLYEFARRVAAEARRQERERLAEDIACDAAQVPMGEKFASGPLAGASVFNVLMWAHRRIKGEER